MMMVTLASIIYSVKGVYSIILQSKLALASNPLAACNIMLSPFPLQLSYLTAKLSNFVTLKDCYRVALTCAELQRE